MEIKSQNSVVLDTPPSCVAFCPAHPEYFAVGTYVLHKTENPDAAGESDVDAARKTTGTQKRTGCLNLYRLRGTEIAHVHTQLLGSAVLDVEWTPHHDVQGSVLCLATSTGSLLFYTLDTSAETLAFSSEKQIADPSMLVLDLLWHPKRAEIIAVTLSDGSTSVCRSSNATEPWSAGSVVSCTAIATHSLEPWTLAFSPDCLKLFSGGDDAVLQCTPLSLPEGNVASEDEEQLSSPSWSDRRVHQAGVTAILPLTNELLVTGSYDDHIRLISAPAVGRRQVIAELNLGGGVWRLKLLDRDVTPVPGTLFDSYTILASCMHAGTRVVRLSRTSMGLGDEVWEFKVLARFEEHKSMNYGSDVQPTAEGKEAGKRVVLSTSFYDRLMCTWEVDLGGKVSSHKT